MNQSIEILEQKLSLARKNGDRRSEAQTLFTLATIHLTKGDTRRTMELLQQSLQLAREVGDLSTEGHALWGMCMVWMSAEIDTQEVRDLGKVALRIFEKLGDPTADLVREILAKQQSGTR